MRDLRLVPERPLSCFDCTHHDQDRCAAYDEPVDSEIFAAQDCAAYEVRRG